MHRRAASATYFISDSWALDIIWPCRKNVARLKRTLGNSTVGSLGPAAPVKLEERWRDNSRLGSLALGAHVDHRQSSRNTPRMCVLFFNCCLFLSAGHPPNATHGNTFNRRSWNPESSCWWYGTKNMSVGNCLEGHNWLPYKTNKQNPIQLLGHKPK